MMKKYILMHLILASLLTFPVITFSAAKGSLTGTVANELFGPLTGATVRIEKTGFGAITDKNGKFNIKSLPAGELTVIISMVGYETKKIPVIIEPSKDNHLEVTLREQPLLTSEVVVSASKRVQAVQDVPLSVSVIDKRSILQKGSTKLSDALAYTPGIEVNKDNVSVRGSSGFSYGFGSRLALLLDGYPLLSGDSGEMKFDALPLFNVERIEVIKGAGSALYGTSALGGVVNIITTEPQENAEYRIKAFSGIYTKPTYTNWEYSDKPHTNSGMDIGYSKRYGDLAVRLSGGVFFNESYRKYDESLRYNLFSKFKYYIGDQTNASLTANYTADMHDNFVFWNGLDSATYPPTDADLNEVVESRKFALFSEINHIFDEKNFMIVRFGSYLTSFDNNYPDTNINKRSSDAYSNNLELQMNTKLDGLAFLTYGANINYNIVSARQYGGDNNQIIGSIYFQGEIEAFTNALLTIGLRFDNEKTSNSDSHTEFSPKLGLSYAVSNELHLRGSIGKGFRAPTVGERFANIPYSGFLVSPNPDIKPESSLSYELGSSYSFRSDIVAGQIDLALFLNEMTDLIEPAFAPDLSGTIMFQNITNARIMGSEISIKAFILGTFGIESSVTLLDPKDLSKDTYGQTLKYRPKVIWYSRFAMPLGAFELQADYRYKDKFENLDEMLRLIQDYDARVDMHVLDIRFIARFQQLADIPITATINCSNLLNYYYTEMVGNLAPTRYVSLQIEADM